MHRVLEDRSCRCSNVTGALPVASIPTSSKLRSFEHRPRQGFDSLWVDDHFHGPRATASSPIPVCSSSRLTSVWASSKRACTYSRTRSTPTKTRSRSRSSFPYRALRHPADLPAHDMLILVCGGGDEITMRIAAQYADTCNNSAGSQGNVKHRVSVLHGHAERLGRTHGNLSLAAAPGHNRRRRRQGAAHCRASPGSSRRSHGQRGRRCGPNQKPDYDPVTNQPVPEVG